MICILVNTITLVNYNMFIIYINNKEYKMDMKILNSQIIMN